MKREGKIKTGGEEGGREKWRTAAGTEEREEEASFLHYSHVSELIGSGTLSFPSFWSLILMNGLESNG